MKYFFTNDPPKHHKVHGNKPAFSSTHGDHQPSQQTHQTSLTRKGSVGRRRTSPSLQSPVSPEIPVESEDDPEISEDPVTADIDQCEGDVITSPLKLSNSFDVLQEEIDDSGCGTSEVCFSSDTTSDQKSEKVQIESSARGNSECSTMIYYGDEKLNSTGYPKVGTIKNPIFSFCKEKECQLCKLHEFTKPLKYTCTYSPDKCEKCEAFHWHEETKNCCRKSHHSIFVM